MQNTRAESIKIKDISINDDFWNKYIPLVKDVILDYQWDAMNDKVEGAPKSHCIENFRIAAGESSGEFYGMVFQDTDLAKWLEAAAYTLETGADKELSDRVEEMVDLVGRAQCKDGYLNTYFTIKEKDQRWKNLREGHELYTAGHFMEAAAAHYEATGNKNLLNIMCKMADVICEYFGPEQDKNHGYPGHPEVELALVRLYKASGNKKYLDMAKYFIDNRGVGENYFKEEMENQSFKPIFPELNEFDPAYYQSHQSVREQKSAEGHAVRAVYLYTAMADIAYEYQDAELLSCCNDLWENIVQKRMFITGGIGSSGFLERFTTDYDLPNASNYSESCASIGLAMFGMRMAQITKDASYYDVVERALYNTVLAGIAMDGKSFFYVNPLEVWPAACMDQTSMAHVKPVRQKWFGVACCPPNIARTLASLGKYIYAVDKNTLFLNLYVSNELNTDIGENHIKLTVQSEFPKEGKIKIELDKWVEDVQLAIRIPEYAKNFKILNSSGMPMEGYVEKGYFYVSVCKEKQLCITFDMEAHFVRANPKVRADAGKVCILRGPLVYTFEEADNGENLSAYYIDTKAPIESNFHEELLGGTTVLTVKAWKIANEYNDLYTEDEMQLKETTLKAIPYAYWCNRLSGEMSVWMKEKWG